MKEIKTGLKKGERAFKLCSTCKDCPIVKISGEEVIITDDFNGKVKMTLSQLREIKKIEL